MADQNMQVQDDPKAAAEAAAGAGAQGAVNGKGHTPEDTDDPAALKAELERVKKAHGQLLNEKGKNAADRQKLTEALKAWNAIREEHDVEPDQIKELLTARDKDAEKQARDKGEVDVLLANQRAKYEAQIKKLEEQNRQLQVDVVGQKDRTIEALNHRHPVGERAGFDQGEVCLERWRVLLHRPKMKIVPDEEAKHGIRVVALVGDSEMSVGDYLKNWAENDPNAWEYLVGSASTGGGAPPGHGRPGMGVWKPRSKMSAGEKSDAITKLGIERYNKLPWT